MAGRRREVGDVMKIISETTLDLYRGPGRCEWCKKPCSKREPHHLRCRGQGSSKRIDIPINLIALGSTLLFQCSCHTKIGAANIKAFEVLAVVAAREDTTPEAITEVMDLIIRLPKDASENVIRREIEKLEDVFVRILATSQLERSGVLP